MNIGKKREGTRGDERRAVSRDRRLGRKRVHRLRAGDARKEVEAECGHLSVPKCEGDGRICGGLEERDGRDPLGEQRDLIDRGACTFATTSTPLNSAESESTI